MITHLKNYLNVRYSTRNLSDEEFEAIVETLAEELENVSFVPQYTNAQLYKDWLDLKKWKTTDDFINSTNRVGMKLCEHFFPNFYDIADNKGNSFNTMWKKDNLIKILRWNRKSHSTPYLSELKRGIYFCTGLTKNTMFRPHLAKTIVSNFSGETVFDPCCGWGGRMLGTLAAGKKYIGFEPNTETYNNLLKLVEFLNLKDKVEIYNEIRALEGVVVVTVDQSDFLDAKATDKHEYSLLKIKYIGRGEKFKLYNGFDRSVSFKFKVAALSKEEMEPMYQKLNYLMSNLMPDYKDSLMRGPLVRMTVGNWIDSQPGIFTSLDYTIPQDSPWEIAINDDLLILPHVVEVKLGFTPIGADSKIVNKIEAKSKNTSYIAQNNTGDQDKIQYYNDFFNY